jgi:hypothetical protein
MIKWKIWQRKQKHKKTVLAKVPPLSKRKLCYLIKDIISCFSLQLFINLESLDHKHYNTAFSGRFNLIQNKNVAWWNLYRIT